MTPELETLSGQLHKYLNRLGLTVSTAESCTGGWLAKALTDVSGSSTGFERGFVSYSNDAKHEMLGVRQDTLEQYGAVSEQTVIEMAEGALDHGKASLSVAISGIAGPSGGTAEKPVGTVWFAWARRGAGTLTETRRLSGNRDAVRKQSVRIALEGLIKLIQEPVGPDVIN